MLFIVYPSFKEHCIGWIDIVFAARSSLPNIIIVSDKGFSTCNIFIIGINIRTDFIYQFKGAIKIKNDRFVPAIITISNGSDILFLCWSHNIIPLYMIEKVACVAIVTVNANIPFVLLDVNKTMLSIFYQLIELGAAFQETGFLKSIRRPGVSIGSRALLVSGQKRNRKRKIMQYLVCSLAKQHKILWNGFRR